MNKLINTFKNKKGMTLVEIVVAIALTGMIVASLSVLTIPIIHSVGKSNNRLKGMQLFNQLEQSVHDQLTNANDCVVFADGNTNMPNDFKYLILKDNYIQVLDKTTSIENTQNILPVEFYEGFKVSSLEIKTKRYNQDTKKVELKNKILFLEVNITIQKSTLTLSRKFYIELTRMRDENKQIVRMDKNNNLIDPSTNNNVSENITYKFIKYKETYGH